MRCVALGIAFLSLMGCVHDDLWKDASPRNQKVKAPLTPKQTLAQQQSAERVTDLGRRIIEQHTFTGIEPVFHLIGVQDPILFHRGTEELFISNGLVEKCKTEEALAAVLASELGRMMAEKRGGLAIGRDVDPLAPAATGIVPASYEKRETDPAKFAAELLRGAGFDPAELQRVEPLLKGIERHDAIRKQMAGSAPAPVWNR